MRRLTAEDYAVDAVTAAKALVGAWLCRRLEDGTVMWRRITETEAYYDERRTDVRHARILPRHRVAGEEEICYTTCVMPNGVMDVV